MIAAHDFALASCQASIFTPDEEISAVKVIKGLLPRWLERFDAEPVILPAPGNLPREVPKVILDSVSGAWHCEMASERVSVFWRRIKSDSPLLPLADVFKEATSLLLDYCQSIQPRVGRLAAVVVRYAFQESPGLFLSTHFCHERWLNAPLNRPESFELHAHKRFLMANRFQVNSWVRNKTGTLQHENAQRNIILIEQDLNTLSENLPSSAYNIEEMTQFFEAVVPELDHILSLYYPIEVPR